MTRVHYRLICHYQTLAFFFKEGEREGQMGARVGEPKTRMKDNGGGEGRGEDEIAHGGNRKKWVQ